MENETTYIEIYPLSLRGIIMVELFISRKSSQIMSLINVILHFMNDDAKSTFKNFVK